MSLVSWDPLREMEQVLSRHAARRGLGREGSGQESMLVADWAPMVDIHETDEEYVIRAELPEVKKDDVSISISNNTLILQGVRKAEKEEKNKRFHRIERSYGSFARSFALPEDINVDKIEADHTDGMLNVHLPKQKTPSEKAVKIKVK